MIRPPFSSFASLNDAACWVISRDFPSLDEEMTVKEFPAPSLTSSTRVRICAARLREPLLGIYKQNCSYQTIIRIPESGPIMAKFSRPRRLSLIALFTALAVVLNLAVAVPAPYEPFLFYEVWEVPILLDVLILGFWDGATVAVLNTLLLEAYRPGALPVAPLYNLIAQLSMFAGVLPVDRIARRRGWEGRKLVPAATAAGSALRTGVMTIVNGIILPLPYPVGFGSGLFPITPADVPGLLVPIGIFNFTIALYTVPLAYSLARAVESRYGGVFMGTEAVRGAEGLARSR